MIDAMNTFVLYVRRLVEDAILPARKSITEAGFDICNLEEVTIPPGEIAVVPTGIAIEFPKEFKGEIVPRSGLAIKGLTIVNSPGTIDSSYRGEIKVIFQNVHPRDFITLPKQSRIAQLTFVPIGNPTLVEIGELSPSARGETGFGASGDKPFDSAEKA
jgi:dUTP pyrophosphatase